MSQLKYHPGDLTDFITTSYKKNYGTLLLSFIFVNMFVVQAQTGIFKEHLDLIASILLKLHKQNDRMIETS